MQIPDTHSPHEVINSPAFRQLVRRRWSVSLVLTLAMLTVYFGFLLVVAFNKAYLAQMVGKNLTLAIPVGLGIILFAWLLTGIYVYWANNHYDQEVANLKAKVK
ncbi:DUF485 domain-containing protein [Telluribacter sp. SYSU D00476]|uniref:DUF485 domain-containing protein n=1 Tax=Telluribacter sp. SYSU D00476 TaxID=2811430 RepID=UPI001FF585D2|nr:DUF485 domain-containing protein [Telluribacter sp. SYSU D00476]